MDKGGGEGDESALGSYLTVVFFLVVERRRIPPRANMTRVDVSRREEGRLTLTIVTREVLAEEAVEGDKFDKPGGGIDEGNLDMTATDASYRGVYGCCCVL